MTKKILQNGIKQLLIISFVSLTLQNTASAEDVLPPKQLGVSPPRIEADFQGQPINQSITLYNYGTAPKQMQLSIVDVDASTPPQPIAPSNDTLSRWSILNPREITIAPNDSQVVRLSIRPKVKLSSGTHNALLVIQQSVEKEQTTTENGVSLRIGSSYAMPIFIHTQ